MKKFLLALTAAALFAATVASEPNISQRFYDFGFELTSKSPKASNNLRKEGVFQFKLNDPDTSVISALYEIGKSEPVPNATWTDRVGDDLTIVVDVPDTRQYRVVISARNRVEKAAKNFESVFYFDVKASEGYKGYGSRVVSYPTPYLSYSEVNNTRIISPIRGALQEGEIMNFALESKDFSKIVFRVNNKVVPLKKKGIKFELETKVPAGIDKLGIYGTKNGKDFTGLWYYKVQKDPPPTKYDDDDEEEKRYDTDNLQEIFSDSPKSAESAAPAAAAPAPTQKTAQQPAQAAAPAKDIVDPSVWNLSKLDTARNVNYMTELEKDVVLEMNMARTNPQKYVELYIAPRIAKFNGNVYDKYLLTKEGAAAVKECVSVMNAQKPLQPFQPSIGLTRAAKDQAAMQSVTDQVGHQGTDGSSPFDRMKRYGSYRAAAENIDYGCSNARDIIVSLLVDDGVASRGHRKNILNQSYTAVGVGCAEHKAYRCMCVIDFAGGYKEK